MGAVTVATLRRVVLLAFLAAFWLVPLAVAAVQLRGLRQTGVPPGARWLLVGVAVLYVVVIPVLSLAFALALAVFDCHGGYECPF
jgi:hypothetical protein